LPLMPNAFGGERLFKCLLNSEESAGGAPMHRGAPRTRATPVSRRPIHGPSCLLDGPARRDVGPTREKLRTYKTGPRYA